jgi:hypothetical protein
MRAKSDKARQLNRLVDTVRAVLGLDPLYPEAPARDAETRDKLRFAREPVSWSPPMCGRSPRRGGE